jgi:crotonobetainyl-CoA:carnitine CoA-transferase CaiB-like acyl-CoA transferase
MRSTADWIGVLEEVNVPCGPINDLSRVFADPHVMARGLRVDIPHPTLGSVPTVASPIRLSKTPVHYRQAAPELGEHTDSVLSNLITNLETKQA